MKIGDAVWFTDELRVRKPAIVTMAWSDSPIAALNLVTLSSDERKTDDHGRQTEHFHSVSPKVEGSPGRFWEPLQ